MPRPPAVTPSCRVECVRPTNQLLSIPILLPPELLLFSCPWIESSRKQAYDLLDGLDQASDIIQSSDHTHEQSTDWVPGVPLATISEIKDTSKELPPLIVIV